MEFRPRLAGVAALFGATAVALGAFGAHGLRETLSPTALGWWNTAAQYEMWHALALLGLAGAPLKRPMVPATLFVLGIIFFSGSLYLMALTGMRWLGAVTPIGGTLLIAGWLSVAWAAWRNR